MDNENSEFAAAGPMARMMETDIWQRPLGRRQSSRLLGTRERDTYLVAPKLARFGDAAEMKMNTAPVHESIHQ